MQKLRILALASLALLSASAQAAPRAVPRTCPSAATALPEPSGFGLDCAFGRDWILKTSDNICGLREANQLTHPALIDYETCLQATPEMRRIKDQGIDPKSAEGIQLRSAAMNRLTDACERVRVAQGHCSVWKEIRHKDGRAIPDLSSQVMALF
jgi:hypothetical protein